MTHTHNTFDITEANKIVTETDEMLRGYRRTPYSKPGIKRLTVTRETEALTPFQIEMLTTVIAKKLAAMK